MREYFFIYVLLKENEMRKSLIILFGAVVLAGCNSDVPREPYKAKISFVNPPPTPRALYSTEAPTKEPYEFRLLNISAPIISEIRLNTEMLRNVDVLDKKLLLVAKKDFSRLLVAKNDLIKKQQKKDVDLTELHNLIKQTNEYRRRIQLLVKKSNSTFGEIKQ
jgi:hypothetical protein